MECGESHTAALASDRTLHTCGAGSLGCLGHFSSTDIATFTEVAGCTGVQQVSCNASTTLALGADGRVLSLHGGLNTIVQGVEAGAVLACNQVCLALAGRAVQWGVTVLDPAEVAPEPPRLPWFAPTMASPPSTPPPEAYSPSPIRAADPFSQSARPNLFSPEISRAKAMAREALVAPTLDNVAHQHRQDWPSYPPGATLAPLPGSPRQPMQVAQAALPSEDRVNEYIVEAYTRCGKPLPESQGSSYTRAAAMEGSCQRYDSEKFSSFDTVVEMQKRLEKLSQEREQLEQACEACDSENQRVAGASLTVREGNDMIAAKIQEVPCPHAILEVPYASPPVAWEVHMEEHAGCTWGRCTQGAHGAGAHKDMPRRQGNRPMFGR